MFKYNSFFLLLLLVAVSLQDEKDPSDGEEINKNICFLKSETGPCKAAIPRWAFNAAEGTCDSFTYGGCKGNENNFESQEECLKRCGTSICSLQPETGPCDAIFPRWAFNTENGTCETFTYGGCGGNKNNFESQEECLNTCGTSICSLPPETGPCRAAISRWAFNADKETCESFTYGGCKGNKNNFESQEECLNTCGTNICSLQPEAGPCYASLKRWAFNADNGICESFTYGGCGGNKNNFESQEECLFACGPVCSEENDETN